MTASLLESPGLFSEFWPFSDYYLFLESFSQRLLMVFNWSLSDTKYNQVSRTLLSILADIIFRLFKSSSLESEWQQVSSSLQDSSQNSNRSKQCYSLDSLDSSSSSPISNSLRTIQVRQSQLVSPSLPCSTAFSVLGQGLSSFILFSFYWFSLCCLPGWHYPVYSKSSFLLNIIIIIIWK